MLLDENYVTDVHREIITSHKWNDVHMRSVVQFAWSMTLRGLSQYPNVQGKWSLSGVFWAWNFTSFFHYSIKFTQSLILEVFRILNF